MKPLGFIIITYNRPGDTLDLLKNIAGLDKAAELLEEIVLVNNNSSSDYSEVENFIRLRQDLPIRYYFSKENLGVTGGRNLAMQKSTAPLLIMIDDDAVLQNDDALVNLLKEFETQNTVKPKAIVSFKVLYFETGQMQQNAFPHKNFDKYKDKHFFETYYYAGGAHAIRRESLEAAGSYPHDFFYGMEEYDLSYRLLEAGYTIIYSDGVVMLHKESPLGRKPKAEKMRMMWLNKSRVARRYLPTNYFWSTAAMWSLQYLRLTGFNLRGYINGWKAVFRIAKTEKRLPLSQEILVHLKKLNARLWY